MDLISVIVPIYNVEQYLEECVASICCQSYQNLEIILVDDGSADNCPRLCDHYASKDNRIKVIHQPNRGLSAARNAGYKESNGKYIAFIDSDDKISNVFIESLYVLLTKNNAQIAACAYTRDPNKLAVKKGTTDYVLTSERMLRGWHGKYKSMETVVCNKLYSRRILERFEGGMIFPEGKSHEDIYTSHLFVKYAERIALTTQKLYYYRRRSESISRMNTRKAAKEDLEAQRMRLEFFKRNKLYAAYLRLYAGHLLHQIKYGKLFWRSGEMANIVKREIFLLLKGIYDKIY